MDEGPYSSAPSTFSNTNGVDWHRYSTKDDITCCSYPIPFTDRDLREDMKKCLGTERLFISFIPLDFFTLPMWPKHPKDWDSPYEGIFYNCLQCHRFTGPVAQLCLQFFFPAFIDISPVLDEQSWSWLPRVICSECSKNTAIHQLTFFPFCMFTPRLIADEIDVGIQQITQDRALQKLVPQEQPLFCIMCSKPLPVRGRKNRKRRIRTGTRGYCSTICVATHRFIKQQYQDNLESERTTGLFQLLDLFEAFEEYRVDLNRALCWNTLCNMYDNHEQSHFYKPTDPTYTCTRCHRVSYCSITCRNMDRANGTHVCTASWDSIFTFERLVIQQE